MIIKKNNNAKTVNMHFLWVHAGEIVKIYSAFFVHYAQSKSKIEMNKVDYAVLSANKNMKFPMQNLHTTIVRNIKNYVKNNQ